jgi:F-type H+-transporting ATPase subunit a
MDVESIFPQVVFTIFGLGITNTVISTWLLMVLIIGGAVALRAVSPTAVEFLFDFLDDLISPILGRSATPYLPFLGTLAIFIGFASSLSILPSIPLPGGQALYVLSPTQDINTPLALAIVVFFAVHYYGVQAQGAWGYLKDLASPIFVLPLEIISQISRTISLTVRLFGNIISTELIVAVIFSLLPLLVPLPLVGFGMFTGFLQAYIFTALAAVYIRTALGESGEP